MKALILCSALLAIAAPANAQVRPAHGQPDALETTVTFSDLDLNRVAGADVMIARLEQAARKVCGEAPSPSELKKKARYRACVTTTTNAAVARIDAPLVTARYNSEQAPAKLAAR